MYLAELMGVSEQTLCRRLRTELPEEEKQNILQIIKEKTTKHSLLPKAKTRHKVEL